MKSLTAPFVSAWHWTYSQPRRGLAIALLLTAVLRLPFLNGALSSDEGGYLYVAQHWGDGGHFLYGPQWVDRPPVLILIFKLCAILGGSSVVVRLVALVIAMLLVAAAYDVGRTLGGSGGAVAGSIATAAIASNALLLGNDLIGDGVGAAFVVASTALILRTRRRHWPQAVSLALAGALASTAVLTKQSALLGFVFATVLVIAVRRLLPALVYLAGAAVPVAATFIWAWIGPGVHQLVDATWTFRFDSARLLWTSDPEGPTVRGLQMVGLVAATGLILVLVLAFGTPFGERRDPVVSSLLAVGLAYFAFSTVYSLNYYNYYLLAATPLVAVAVPAAMARGWWLDDAAIGTAAFCAVAAIVAAFIGPPSLSEQVAVEKAIKSAAHPGDTALVIYGQPNVLQATGLTTPYPYSWSLPARVKDPDQKLLVSTLSGPQAPTWIAEIGNRHDWGYGTPALDQVLADRYALVETVRGHAIYRLK